MKSENEPRLWSTFQVPSRLPVDPPEAAAVDEEADGLDAPGVAAAAEDEADVDAAELDAAEVAAAGEAAALGEADVSGTFEMLTGGGPDGCRNRYQMP